MCICAILVTKACEIERNAISFQRVCELENMDEEVSISVVCFIFWKCNHSTECQLAWNSVAPVSVTNCGIAGMKVCVITCSNSYVTSQGQWV